MPTPPALQRKPFWAPVGLAGAAAVTAALVIALLAWLSVTAKSTTVIVVRDAERVSDGAASEATPNGAGLSSAGRTRAELLARMFGDTRLKDRVDDIYVSPDLATQATAQPLAARLNVTPLVVAARTPRAWARRVLGEHRGGRVLVVADAATAHDLTEELSGMSDLPPMQFGNLYIVTVPRIGRANLLSVGY
jgi:broad specificity phosphatase PhoE